MPPTTSVPNRPASNARRSTMSGVPFDTRTLDQQPAADQHTRITEKDDQVPGAGQHRQDQQLRGEGASAGDRHHHCHGQQPHRQPESEQPPAIPAGMQGKRADGYQHRSHSDDGARQKDHFGL